MQGVVDISHGTNVLFQVANLERLHEIPARFQASAQYRRLGPIFAGLMNRVPEVPFVRIFTIDKMSGPPRIYTGFHCIS
jgi:hypothetical protein